MPVPGCITLSCITRAKFKEEVIMSYVVLVYIVTCIVCIHGGHFRSRYWRTAPHFSAFVRVHLGKATAFVPNFNKASP